MLAILKSMLQGVLVSVNVFFLTLLFSIPLGMILCALRMSHNKVFSTITRWFLLIIRGTPLMLQLIIMYFGPSMFVTNLNQMFDLDLKLNWPRFVAAIVALVINYACYFSEIYRGGVESIPRGQYEAAKVLGYSKNQTSFFIVIPQVIKRIIPAMGNEVITLVKDTALVQVIGVVELLHISKTAANRMFSTMPLFLAGVFYFLMNWVVQCFFNFIEKKLSYYK